jgi:hypothetical protein
LSTTVGLPLVSDEKALFRTFQTDDSCGSVGSPLRMGQGSSDRNHLGRDDFGAFSLKSALADQNRKNKRTNVHKWRVCFHTNFSNLGRPVCKNRHAVVENQPQKPVLERFLAFEIKMAFRLFLCCQMLLCVKYSPQFIRHRTS